MFPAAARALLLALAVCGVAQAAPSERVRLARAYEHGERVPRNPELAVWLYCEAARDTDADASWALGWMYLNGRGIPRDDSRAKAMFEWAAQFGHEHAQRMLERMRSVTPETPDCLRPTTPPTAWGPPEPAPEPPVVAEPPLPPPDPFADLPPQKQPVADLVGRLAPRFGVEPRLALSVIHVESNFDPLARSPKDARGLMQLIPETAARYNVRNPFDPRQNVAGGLAYLRFLLAYYRGDVALALAAYNAGEKVVDRYRGIPPFAETRGYVQKVLALYGSVWHPFDASHAPSPSAVVGSARAN
jgi:TPR repeat protein